MLISVSRKLMNGPPVGAPVQIRISGPDQKTLYHLRDKIAAIVEKTPGVAVSGMTGVSGPRKWK